MRNEEQERRLLHKLQGELGPVVMAALADSSVVEVMLNPDGYLWVDQFGVGMVRVGEMSAVDAMAAMGTIADALHTTVTRAQPVLEGELPINGERFEGLIPPAVAAPVFTIRKKAERVFTLGDYVDQGVMTAKQKRVIEQAIDDHLNILVVGGTGSGKTTLTNAVIAGIAVQWPDERIVAIEDTAELQIAAENAVCLRSTVSLSMQALLRATMRLRPDRILVGEVRGGEALALLKAWNTGHPGGVATLHANDARAGLIRLEQLVAESGLQVGVPELIGEAVGLVVVITKVKSSTAGRQVTELMEVRGYEEGAYKLSFIT